MDPLATTQAPQAGALADLEISDDSILRELAAAPSIRPWVDLCPGQLIAETLEIKGELGVGGMGVVYLAWDTELERNVALKLQHGGSQTDAMPRLAREARAMARLSHPNVVPVHAVGQHQGRLFISMEYVPGGTARQWAEAPRTWQETVALYVAAGRGLAAAHALGMIHRDFKPDNVLVGRDGRARVADFGLARASDGDDYSGTQPVAAPGTGENAATHATQATPQSIGVNPSGQPPPSDSLKQRLTQAGAAVGTVAYMSPEQFLNLELDGRADQFSFCVALYEALHQERPFAGATAHALLDNIQAHALRESNGKFKGPKRVVQALRRGLRANPAERFASMDELLAVLDRKPLPTRALVLAGVLLVAAIAAGSYALREQPVVSPCIAASEQLDLLWTPEQRAASETAFTALGKDYALGVFTRVDAQLNDYAAHWKDRSLAACKSREAWGERSLDALNQQLACLDSGRAAFANFVGFLPTITTTHAGTVIDRANALPAMARCSDLDGLARITPLPSAPHLKAEIARIDADVAIAQQDFKGGDPPAAEAELAPLLEQALATGYRPLIAKARYWLAQAHREMGRPGVIDEARTTFHDALAAGDDRLAILSVSTLVRALGDTRSPEAESWAETGWALAERLPSGHGLELPLLRAQGTARALRGELPESRELFQQALDLPGTKSALTLGALHADMGRSWGNAGKPEQAEASLNVALAHLIEALGPTHHAVSGVLGSIGRTWILRADFVQASTFLEQALEIELALLSDDHPHVARLQADLADAYVQTGNHPRALALLPHAVEVLRAARSVRPYGHTDAEVLYAALLFEAGQRTEASQRFGGVIQELQDGGDEPQKLTYALRSWAGVLVQIGDLDAAEQLLSEVEVVDPLEQRPGLGQLEKLRGRIAMKRKDWPLAIHSFQAAVARLEVSKRSPAELAQVRYLLMQAHFNDGQPVLARAQGQAAVADLADQQDHSLAKLRTQVRELLAEHAGQ